MKGKRVVAATAAVVLAGGGGAAWLGQSSASAAGGDPAGQPSYHGGIAELTDAEVAEITSGLASRNADTSSEDIHEGGPPADAVDVFPPD